MNSTPLRDAALDYAQNGFPVLPLKPRSKEPIGNLVPRAHLDATTDPRKINLWWSIEPEANIGIALGAAGLVDIAPDSIDWHGQFIAFGLPLTMHYTSGGGEGHEHYLYRRGEMPTARIAFSGMFDVLSDGFAVAPPSVHESGRVYQWVDHAPPADALQWMHDFVARYLAQRSFDAISDALVIPFDTDEPPIVLTADQEQVWGNQAPKGQRSDALVDIARMLCEAGYRDVEGIASILAERDITLGLNKYAHRKDASRRYREIALRYGRPPLRAHLSGAPVPVPPMGMGTGNRSSSQGQPPEGVGVSDPIKWRSHQQTLDLLPPNIDWFIEGVLGRGLITELVAKVKMGKTTFMLQGVRAGIAGDDEYCGRAVKPLRAAYVTEEGWQTFQLAMRRYGLNDLVDNDAFFTVFDFETEDVDPKKPNLPFVIDSLIRHATDDRVDVIILDTLSIIASLDEEDHSGKAAGVMAEVRRLTTEGFAVGILRHSRKSGGDVGDAGRGSSAISGYCDILLQIEPFKGDEDATSARVMRTKSRLGVYEPLMLAFDKTTERYSSSGPLVSGQERLEAAVLKALGDLDATSEEKAKTSLEVTAKSGKRKQAVTDTLKMLVAEGKVASVYRGKAVVYWLKLIIHLTHEPVPPVPEQQEQVEPHTPFGGVDTAPSVPEPVPQNAPSVGGEQGNRKTPKPLTPEQVAKRSADKAERERLRLEAADAAAPTLDYATVLDDIGLASVLPKLNLVTCALDTETTGLDAKRDKLRTINLSDGQTHVVVDVQAVTANAESEFPWRLLQAYLDQVGEVRMHTYLFDLAFLQQVGLTVDPSKILDVRTVSLVLEAQEDWLDYRLQGIAKRHLDEHVEKREQKGGWDAPTLRHAKLAYAAEDARVTYAAGDALLHELEGDRDAELLVHCIGLERSVQAATWWLASAGAPCDTTILRQAIKDQDALVAERLAELNKLAMAVGVNWRSPSQVLPILQDRGLEVMSTGVDALMEAQSDDPIIDALLAYRSAGTCRGLLQKTLGSVAADGRIYAAFNPIGAQTGRTSCSEPNLQQLPHDTAARSSIRPREGRVFVRADYSQLQIVIAAWLSNDANMQRILNSPGGDIHAATAKAVGCSRDQAKAINFGFLFGAGADTFRREQRKNGIILTDEQARGYRATFMRTYPGIRKWHRSLGEWGDEAEVIDDTGSGRRRSRIFSNNVKANTPVQMAEAHGFKLALKALYEHRYEVPSARLVMMVHDELIAECDYEDRYATAQWLKTHMVNAMQPLVDGVRIEVETTIVPSYSDEDKKNADAR